MRTLYPAVLIIAIAVVFGAWSAAGVGAYFDASAPDVAVDDELESDAEQSDVNQRSESNPPGGAVGDIITLVTTTIGSVWNVIVFIASFPSTMGQLFLPQPWATPLGWAAALVGGIGAAQFLGQRVYQ